MNCVGVAENSFAVGEATYITFFGAVRDGGSYETRMGGIACWNAIMDENAYMVQKWNEFVAA